MSGPILSEKWRIPDAGTRPRPYCDEASSYLVAASGELLGALVISHLLSVNPQAKIAIGKATATDAGATVTNTGTGRWLHISASVGPDHSYAKALDRGAASVLGIHSSRAEFDLAVQALQRQNGSYVPPDVVSWLVTQSLNLGAKPQERQVEVRLTAREREVLRLVLEGQANQEIAKSLTISPNTVRSHMRALSVKLEASNRARLVHRARALGFDEATPGSHLRDLSA